MLSLKRCPYEAVLVCGDWEDLFVQAPVHVFDSRDLATIKTYLR